MEILLAAVVGILGGTVLGNLIADLMIHVKRRK